MDDAERVRAVCSATPPTPKIPLPLETSALHPSTPDKSSSMKSACPA